MGIKAGLLRGYHPSLRWQPLRANCTALYWMWGAYSRFCKEKLNGGTKHMLVVKVDELSNSTVIKAAARSRGMSYVGVVQRLRAAIKSKHIR